MSNQTTTTYDALGNAIALTDAIGNITSFSYDAMGRQTGVTDALGAVTSFNYDAFGNFTSVTDALGAITSFTYDALYQQTGITDALGATTSITYDEAGNAIALTDALGQTTSFNYDALNQQIGIIDALGAITSFTYDAVGNATSITDSVSNTTSYTYDAIDRLLTNTNSLGDTRFYGYDAVSNLTSTVDRNGREISYSYDALDRQTQENWLDESGNPIYTFSYTYDAVSQLIAAFDPDSAYSYVYDAMGQVTEVDNAGTPGVPNVLFNYTYDAVGNKLSVTDTIDGLLAGIEVFTYDALNRTTAIAQTGNGVTDKRVNMTYDAVSQLTNLTRYADLSGTQTVAVSDYVYDQVGRLTDLTHSTGGSAIASYNWTYDQINRITQFTSPDGTSNYNYDATNQLTGTDSSYQSDEAYVYDENGNRINSGYVTGSNNQLLSDGIYNYEYDAEGNRTRRTEIANGEVTQYSWDYRNRLIQVDVIDNAGNIINSADYTYDVFDRRISKTVDADGEGNAIASLEQFVYDGDNIALVFDGSGDLTSRYFYGTEVDQILAEEKATGEVLWALTDNQGTVSDLIDSTGTVLNHITYDSYGNVTSESNSAVDFRFGYTGREWDAETGQYYYRARYYDPTAGEFISSDPMGFAAGDTNLYRYVGNSPLNATDPSGNKGVPSKVSPLPQVKPFPSNPTTLKPNPLLLVPQIFWWIFDAGPVQAPGVPIQPPRRTPKPTPKPLPVLRDNPNDCKEDEKKKCKTSILYRGDSRTPLPSNPAIGRDGVFITGFRSKGKNDNLLLFAEKNVPSIFISTSKLKPQGIKFANDYGKRDGYLYEICDPGGGRDVNKELGFKSPFREQEEVVFEKLIESRYIKSATSVNRKGSLGTTIQNPGYNPSP